MEIDAHLRRLPPVEVVYTDLDGTLLGAGGSVLADADGAPSLAAVEALVAARRAGVAVVAVSGRRMAQVREDVALLGLDGAIAEAGGVRIVDGEVRMSWGRCPRDAATPREALASHGAPALLLGAFGETVRPYAPWDEGRLGGYLLHGRLDVAAADALLADNDLGWAHVLDNGPTGGWPELGAVNAYHLVPRGVGKAVAVAEDLLERGISRGAALAIGDSGEDATLAGVVGTYVAVADGVPAAAPNAFLAAGRSGEGVAEAIGAALSARPAAEGG